MTEEVYARASHGTSVLGLLVGGFDEILDISPLVPGVRMVLADARDRLGEPPHKSLSDAIDRLAASRCGILLIPRDWSSRAPHLPYELRPGVAELLVQATRIGVVVVQAAGNGGLSLDQLVHRNGPFVRGQVTIADDPWLQPEDAQSPAFAADTGAIVVGASTATRPFRRWCAGFETNPQPKSNFGSRVDCCAPGEDLFTASGPGTEGRPGYTHSFGGTSGAATIIAAAVAAIQSIVIQETGSPLNARIMRALLSDPSLGHATQSDGDPIGTVPDIRLILERLLGKRVLS
jgi:hypothetical protein